MLVLLKKILVYVLLKKSTIKERFDENEGKLLTIPLSKF